MWWLLGIALGLTATWLLLVAALYISRPEDATLGEAFRLLPDTIRLVKRLASERRVPRSSRAMLWVLLGYLISPIDVVPDFLPVIGYADDAILVGLVLRHIIRHAGVDVVSDHWPGSELGLATLLTLAGTSHD